MFIAIALTATLLLSWASYAWVEDPARRSAWLTAEWRWRPRVVVGWVAGAAVVLGAGVLVTTEITRPAEAVEPDRVAAVDCFGAAYLANGCSPEDVTGEVVPAVDVISEDTGGAYACWRAEGAEAKSCTYGSEEPDAPRVALVGDSHAAMLLPGILPQLDELGWRLDTFVGFGCQWRDGGEESDCAEPMAEIDEQLSSGDYDLVLTSAARWASDDAGAPADFASAWSRALDAGTRVVAIGDAPTVSEETLACVQRVVGDPSECATPWAEASQPADSLVGAVELEPRAALVDMTDRFCVDDVCPAVIGGVVVYRDGVSHTTGTYMTTLGPELMARVDDAAMLRTR
jgi:hypothetical protein